MVFRLRYSGTRTLLARLYPPSPALGLSFTTKRIPFQPTNIFDCLEFLSCKLKLFQFDIFSDFAAPLSARAVNKNSNIENMINFNFMFYRWLMISMPLELPDSGCRMWYGKYCWDFIFFSELNSSEER